MSGCLDNVVFTVKAFEGILMIFASVDWDATDISSIKDHQGVQVGWYHVSKMLQRRCIADIGSFPEILCYMRYVPLSTIKFNLHRLQKIIRHALYHAPLYRERLQKPDSKARDFKKANS